MNDLDVANMLSVPNGVKNFVTEPKYKEIVDNFFSQIMIDTEDLIFAPMAIKCLLQLPRAFQVVTERLFDLCIFVNQAASRRYILGE